MKYIKLTIFTSLVSCLFFLVFAGSASASITIRPMNNLSLVGYWPMEEGVGTKARGI